MAEEWRPVVGYEGLYEVSDHGRVRSLDIIDSKNRLRKGIIRKISPSKSDGRFRIDLSRSGKKENFLVHRLILLAFVGQCPDGMEGCHNDGNPENNHLSNLRWDTRSENMIDRQRHGTDHHRNKTHCPRGHALEFPNLQSHSLRMGHRGCAACKQTSQLKSFSGWDDKAKEISDVKFAKIMRGSIVG